MSNCLWAPAKTKVKSSRFAFEESFAWALLSYFYDDSNLHISIKYVLTTKGASKESISKFLTGIDFTQKLHILNPEIYKQCLRVKSWKAKVGAAKANKLKIKMNKSEHKLQQFKNWKICLYHIFANRLQLWKVGTCKELD